MRVILQLKLQGVLIRFALWGNMSLSCEHLFIDCRSHVRGRWLIAGLESEGCALQRAASIVSNMSMGRFSAY